MVSGIRKRRTAHSSTGKVTRRNADRNRTVRIKSDPVVKANWNPKKTLIENYRQLGLVSKLNSIAGGTANSSIGDASASKIAYTPFAINTDGSKRRIYPKTAQQQQQQSTAAGNDNDEKTAMLAEDADAKAEAELRRALPKGYGLIQRDEEGNIVKVITSLADEDEDDTENSDVKLTSGGRADLLDWLDEEVQVAAVAPKTKVAEELERIAQATSGSARIKTSTEADVDFCRKAIKKHGDDYRAMARDMKLNTYQFTEGNIKKRIKRFLQEGHEL
ncbi:hypothetical protein GQ42DRAFT_161137 [Ramicandelaber brevisporus]|nr:hypothetical protein GQ42DRAFT_161137 [Ramicandelaber brevisporus]